MPYDGREHPRQKYYLQALLRLKDTLPLAHGRLPSIEFVAFYKLLLRGVKVRPGLTNKEYVVKFNEAKGTTNKMVLALKDTDDPDPRPSGHRSDFFAPLAEGPAPKPKPRAASFSRGGRGTGGRGGTGGNVPPLTAPVVEPPGGDPVPPIMDGRPPVGGGGGDVPSEGGASSSGAGGGDASSFFAPPLLPDTTKGPLVTSLNGLLVQYHRYMNKRTGREEPHWILVCTSCGVPGCSKRRGAIPSMEKTYGEVEPLAFLHAWHDIPWSTHPTKATHALETPSKEAVRELAETHLELFRNVCREAGR